MLQGELDDTAAFEATALDELSKWSAGASREEQARRHEGLRKELAAVARFCRLLEAETS
ncbi:MAG: hypothetical protein R3C97_06050 [Geminicoccaceae bacterium]